MLSVIILLYVKSIILIFNLIIWSTKYSNNYRKIASPIPSVHFIAI